MKLRGLWSCLAVLALLAYGPGCSNEKDSELKVLVKKEKQVQPPETKVASVEVMRNIRGPVELKSVLGTDRSAGVRSGFRRPAGLGDGKTEAAVLMALRWLKATQDSDGSWGCRPGVNPDRGYGKAGDVGLALLAFLAHGETPDSAEFGPTVRKAIEFLVDGIQRNERYRGMAGTGYLIATYALCEAYCLTRKPNVREAVKKALARIARGQTPTGGWNGDLEPEGADDIAATGWVLLALKSAGITGLVTPDLSCAEGAVPLLRQVVQKKDGFCAVGCLALQLHGHAKDPEVACALSAMQDWQPTLGGPDMPGGLQGTYYATQCKYHAGMSRTATPANWTAWKKWNAEMKALYPKSIVPIVVNERPVTVTDAKGADCPIGYWRSEDRELDDVMSTCLVALQLMVYYRYLPTTSLKATEVDAYSREKRREIGVSIDI